MVKKQVSEVVVYYLAKKRGRKVTIDFSRAWSENELHFAAQAQEIERAKYSRKMVIAKCRIVIEELVTT